MNIENKNAKHKIRFEEDTEVLNLRFVCKLFNYCALKDRIMNHFLRLDSVVNYSSTTYFFCNKRYPL